MLLILVSALFLMTAASMFLLRWQDLHSRSAPFNRVRTTARLLDLMAKTPPSLWAADITAFREEPVKAQIVDVPPSPSGYIHAPRLEAKLKEASSTALGRSTLVFTSRAESHRDGRDGVEGFMALAVTKLPGGGGYLVSKPLDRGAHDPIPVYGLPTEVWIALLGAVLAFAATMWAAAEVRPLRDLTLALDRFDGSDASLPVTVHGAPDVKALTSAVIAMQGRVAGLMRERMLILGGVSHDLRTLIMRIQLRTLRVSDEPTRIHLENDIECMQALVEDALTYAREGDLALVRRKLDFADIVASEIAEREAIAAIAIEARIKDAPLWGDANALRRVAANLIDNALKFGAGRVRVILHVLNAHVVFSVEDNGPGIPAGQREAVLMPFFRIDASRNRETGGSGLGLAIADRVVREHGGVLKVESSDLGGACLCVLLPSTLIPESTPGSRPDEATTKTREINGL